MTTMYMFSTRKTCLLVLCVFCLVVLSIYIASERLPMEFYAQDNTQESISRTRTQKKQTPVIDQKQDTLSQDKLDIMESTTITITTTTPFSTSQQKSTTSGPLSSTTGSQSTETGSTWSTTGSLSSTTGSPSSTSASPVSTKTEASSTTMFVSSSSEQKFDSPGNKSVSALNKESISPLISSSTTISSESLSGTSSESKGTFTSTKQISSDPESQRASNAHNKSYNNTREELNHVIDFLPVIIDANNTLDIIQNNIKGQKGNINVNSSKKYFKNYGQVHRERIKQIKQACSDKKRFGNNTYSGNPRIVYYESQEYKFSYCKVPKSGSTFWTKTFGVLKRGLNYGKFIFNVARRDVHGSMLPYLTTVYDVIDENSRTILVSRDPYSRLFSAYIDKSFLLLIASLNYRIRHIPEKETNQGLKCPVDVSFNEFLDWVIKEGLQGKTLDRHWSPISSLCWPCKVNSFILVKQESFSKDVEFALKQVGVEREKLDYIKLALHDNRAELSLPGIIDTLFRTAHKKVISECLGFLKFSRRVWISLQIQGHIDDQAEFPLDKFKSAQFTNYNSKQFAKIVLETLHDFPMTSEQRRQQRFKYLYQAFKTIRPETIKGIQELYRTDFELFGYSLKPPTKDLDV